jgi:hypothetical protein
MSKSKSKSKSRNDRSGKGPDRRWNVIAAVVAAVIVGWVGYSWWQSSNEASSFTKLASAGKAISSKIETFPSQGQRHLIRGAPYNYPHVFPTSGPHDPVWVEPGFYTSRQRPTKLVHALEHGNIVIYYDEPGDEVMRKLKSWASLYPGQWDGLVVTPKPGIGQKVALTAWTKLLRLEKFDASSAAAFIDMFRGRGPENPMR